MRVRTILSVSALDTTYATYMQHMSHYPETYLKQWPGFRPLTKQPDMFRELFLKARIEIEMSLMREGKRERGEG